MKAGRIFPMPLILCLLALLLPAQAMAAGTAQGIVMGCRAVVPGNTVVMAGTDWDVVLDTASTGDSDGRLLMTAGVKSAGKVGYLDQMACIDSFYDSSFSGPEKAAVMSTYKSDPAFTYDGLSFSDSSLNGAKLFALSASEALQYFGADDERLPGGWWLRSTDWDSTFLCAYIILPNGSIFKTFADIKGPGVRPALNLKLSSVLFSSAAEGGKSIGAGGAAMLYEIPSNPSGRWKLTLLDPDRVFSASAAATDSLTAARGYDAWALHLTYGGALAGDNEYVSALLCDAVGRARYYGRLASDSASGTALLHIPVGLGVGDYTLRLFSEQCNGDSATDCGSAFVDIPLTVTGESHTVTFDMAGAGDNPAPQTVGHGDVALEPDAALFDGYTFTGWEYQPSGAAERIPFDFTRPVTEDTTLFARWSYEPGRVLTVNPSGLDHGGFIVTGSDGKIYALNRPVRMSVPKGVALTLSVTPDRNCTFSGSISLGNSAQGPTALSSGITSYNLGYGDVTVDLTFERLPVLTMNVTPDDLGEGFWTVTDGRRDTEGNPVNCYGDGSSIPVPGGDVFSTEDSLTLTVVPGPYGFDGSIDNNGAVTRIVDGMTSYTFAATGPVTVSLNYYDRSAYHTIRFHDGYYAMSSQRVAASGSAGQAVTATLNRAAYSRSDIFGGWNTVETPTPENPGIAYADGAEITLNGDADLYAQWIDAWAVSFSANGGEGSMDKYRLPKSDATGALPPCAFSRSGYAFDGWNNRPNGGGDAGYADGAGITLTGNLTLYAQWTPAWTVTFDPNGGRGDMPPLPVAKGRSAALPASAFTREGYAFAGWAAAENGGAAYADGAAVAPADDMTLFAVWTPVAYRIAYELDGGALPQGAANPAEYTIESPAIQLRAPAKKGFAFDGWYADARFERQVSGIGSGSTGDRTFYAKWAEAAPPDAFGPAAFLLPSGLAVIEESAFEGMTAMTVVDAGSVTAIGKRAFRGCTGLTQIRLPGNCAIEPDAFEGCGTVYVFAQADGTTEAYCQSGGNPCVFVEEARN